MTSKKYTYTTPAIQIKSLTFYNQVLSGSEVTATTPNTDEETLTAGNRYPGSSLDFSGCGNSNNYNVDWDF